jgi:hypothetical protein
MSKYCNKHARERTTDELIARAAQLAETLKGIPRHIRPSTYTEMERCQKIVEIRRKTNHPDQGTQQLEIPLVRSA